MKEIIINYSNQKKDILVVENGKIVEQYKEYENNRTLEGNVYIGKVLDVLDGMQAAFVDIGEERNAFLHIKDVLPKVSDVTGNKNEKMSDADISKYIKVGSPVVVQVKKDRIDTKGARISTDINIGGKYVALVPNSNFVTVSSKIEDVAEAERLKKIIQENLTASVGVIVRTAAVNKNENEIINDLNNLCSINEKIMSLYEKYSKSNEYPRKLYEAGGIVNKVLLGLVDSCDKIITNNEEIFNYVKEEYPEYNNDLVLKDDENIIDSDFLNQLEKLENRKIWLNCGGFITIDKTEALTAIDVNTGKYTGKNSLEKTIFKVNEEATIEIARQIRARDIGGIVIIDFIDMEEEENEKKIMALMEKELKKDRAKTQVVGFTPLHLLEMTRKHLCSN